jgi:hypothetical protein
VSDSLVFLPCAPSPSPRSLRFGGQLLAVCGLSRVYEYNTVSSLWLACDALRILMHSALRRDGGGFLLPRFRFLAAAAAAGCMRCCARSALSCLESHSLHRSLPQCCSACPSISCSVHQSQHQLESCSVPSAAACSMQTRDAVGLVRVVPVSSVMCHVMVMCPTFESFQIHFFPVFSGDSG